MSHNTNNNNATSNRELDCTDISVLMSGLLDDQLDADVRHLAERHLASCPACRKSLDQAEMFEADLAAALREVDEIPDGFEAAVLSSTTRSGPMHITARSRWFNTTGWLAAAAAITIAAVGWMNPFNSSNDAQPGLAGGKGVVELAGTNDAMRSRSGNGAMNVARNDDRGSETVSVFASYYPLGAEVISAPMDRYLEPIKGTFMPLKNAAAVSDGGKTISATTESAFANVQQPALGFENATSSAVVLDRPMYFTGNSPRVFREDQETLKRVAEVLQMLAAYEGESMKPAEDMRRIIESDNLLKRLERSRQRIAPEHRFVLLNAESILWHIVEGPIAEVDLREMRDAARTLDITGRIERIAGPVDPGRSM
ncbi:MAG: anti-sigma factor family protein [Phycisphaerales bacterium]